MKRIVTVAAWVVLGAAAASWLFVDRLTPASYSQQFREYADAPPSTRFLLGADALGRDRFSRLLHGSRISITLATAAAACSTLIAALVGGSAGFWGGRYEKFVLVLLDIVLSLPWLFLLLIGRAVLPLNAAPEASLVLTFGLLAVLGWAAPARVVCAAARRLRNSPMTLYVRACGLRSSRLFLLHAAPNLRPVLLAQFWISIPVFILSEANLSLLGLGVSEPLPSWGTLLRELESGPDLINKPWIAASALALAVVVSALQSSLAKEEPA